MSDNTSQLEKLNLSESRRKKYQIFGKTLFLILNVLVAIAAILFDTGLVTKEAFAGDNGFLSFIYNGIQGWSVIPFIIFVPYITLFVVIFVVVFVCELFIRK